MICTYDSPSVRIGLGYRLFAHSMLPHEEFGFSMVRECAVDIPTISYDLVCGVSPGYIDPWPPTSRYRIVSLGSSDRRDSCLEPYCSWRSHPHQFSHHRRRLHFLDHVRHCYIPLHLSVLPNSLQPDRQRLHALNCQFYRCPIQVLCCSTE